MTQIGNHDDAYLSTPLEEKLAWFQNAPGLSAVEPARQFMAGAAALYTDSDSQVRVTMRSLGADWAGEAATNAGTTLQRAADWSQSAGAGHAAGGQTVEGYGQSFESLRGQVHWDDPWAWGWNDTASAAASVVTLDPALFLGNLTTDYFTTAQQNRTNDAAAVAALRAHEQQTRTAVESFPAIAPAGIDPSAADAGATPGGRGREGLGSAPVAPAPVATAGAGGIGPGAVLGAVGGGVATGVGAAAGGSARSADPAGGGAAGGINGGGGGASTTPIPGTAGAATGPIGNAGTTTARPGGPTGGGQDGANGRIPPGPAGGGPGAGGFGPGGLGPGGLGAGGSSANGPGSGGVGAEGGAPEAGAVRPGGLAGQGGQSGLGGRAGTASRGTTIPNEPIPGVGPLGADPSIRGGRATLPGLPGQVGGGDPAGRWTVAPSPGDEASGGGRGPAEPGALSRGPASGAEFAARLPSGSPETPAAGARSGTAGSGMPFLGGMGAGAGARSTEHRHAYWIRSSEPFDVPLPPHGDGLLQGTDE